MFYQGHGVSAEEDGKGKVYDKTSLTDGERLGITITEGEVEETR